MQILLKRRKAQNEDNHKNDNFLKNEDKLNVDLYL